MIKSARFIVSFLLLLLSLTNAHAEAVEMADQWTSNGKIYIVVAVLLIILFGIFAYLVSLDRRMRKMESNITAAEKVQRSS